MSRAKGVEIEGRLLWVADDEHDIVLASMVESAEALDFVPAEWISDWRTWACVPDLAFATEKLLAEGERETLACVLHLARDIAAHRGDVTREHVQEWVLGDGLVVCAGTIRREKVTVSQIVAVIDTFLYCLGLGPEGAGLGASPTAARQWRLRSRVGWIDVASDALALPFADGERTDPSPREASRDIETISRLCAVHVVEAVDEVTATDPVTVGVVGTGGRFELTREEESAIRTRLSPHVSETAFLSADRSGYCVVRARAEVSATSVGVAVAVLKKAGGWDEMNPIIVCIDDTFVAVTFAEASSPRAVVIGRRRHAR